MRLAWILLAAAAVMTAQPPATKRIDHVDVYHGVRVPDPYRWLEDPDTPEARAWIDAQNSHTRSVLDQLPGRDALRARLEQTMRYDTFATYSAAGGTVAGYFVKGGRTFTYFRKKRQNQPALSVREADGSERALLDPNPMSKDGTTAVNSFAVSPDGKWLAYALSVAGSDWQEWRIRDVATGKDLPEVLKHSKFFGAAWEPSGDGFYYGRYPAPKEGESLRAANENYQLWYHRRGTPQSDDRLVFERPGEKQWYWDSTVSNDGRYLILEIRKGTASINRVYYQDRANGGKITPLIDEDFAEFVFLGNRAGKLIFRSNWQAPRGKVIEIDLSKPERSAWKTLVPEATEPLDSAQLAGGKLVLKYLQDVKSLVKVAPLDGGAARTIPLPPNSTAYLTEGSASVFGVMSFLAPLTIYNCANAECGVIGESSSGFVSSQFETKQVMFESTGGVKVPMFLVYRKGLKLDGANRTLLTAYGGFNVSVTPGFNPARLTWVERGGVLAVANLRGGSEYGEEWHKAGMKQNKQNVFDDFINAGEWLVKNKYTSPSRLAITGGSNGGLLVGAVLNQRPNLFGAAVPMVGVMDMLRFDQFTIGAAWTSEYGSPQDAEDFKAIRNYSPLHNIKPGGKYPATMVMTADHDDRVVPAHSFKYAAALQAAQSGGAPILIRIETGAGHGAGKPISKQVETEVDAQSFLESALK